MLIRVDYRSVRTTRLEILSIVLPSGKAPENKDALIAPNLDDRRFADIIAEAKTLITLRSGMDELQ